MEQLMSYSHNLPVIKSFFDPYALGQVISQAYALSNVHCQLIKATMRDVYYVMSREGNFVALVYRASHSQASIREEIALTDYLAAQGLSVVTALRQINGEHLLTLTAPEGSRHAILLPFAHGTISRNPDPHIIRRYGALIAELHRRTNGIPDPYARPIYNAEALILRSMKVLEATSDYLQTVMRELQQIAKKLYLMLQALPKTKPCLALFMVMSFLQTL
jgi:Ser/Thr protein kinase RdoA (MazF antagonist)